jgi:osmotically-inducible protein OsmY
MADYNSNRHNRYDRDREHNEYDSYGRPHNDREDWEQYRRQNIAGYDPYTSHNYGRRDEYGNYTNYNDDRYTQREQRASYGNRPYGDWDRQDNRYGSYNAGYSDYEQRRVANRRDRDYDDYYGGPYGAGGNYGRFGGPTSNRIPYQDESYRRASRDRDRGDWDRRRDNRDNRSFWERATDEVASWFGEDDRDERHKQSHRGKGPKDYSRSDERIREDICDRLSDDPYIDASDINIRVNNGEVILDGHAESKQAKRRAEDLAEKISGVKNVENHLKVAHSTATVGSSRVYTQQQENTKKNRKSGWL